MSQNAMIFPALEKSEERLEIAEETIWPLPEGENPQGGLRQAPAGSDAPSQ